MDAGTGDPLSVTDSVIAVAGPAFKSAKTPNEAIASFANAPELPRGLGNGLGILQNVLQALKEELDGVPNADLANDQKACFEGLKPASWRLQRSVRSIVSHCSQSSVANVTIG